MALTHPSGTIDASATIDEVFDTLDLDLDLGVVTFAPGVLDEAHVAKAAGATFRTTCWSCFYTCNSCSCRCY